ncbi:hypothetical protein OAF05_00985 [bacterium]|nr:hypothetical protein [bacterium]
MKFIILFDTFRKGGLEKTCIQLCQEFSSRGLDFEIWTLAHSQPYLEIAISGFLINCQVRYFSRYPSLFAGFLNSTSNIFFLSLKNHLSFVFLRLLFRPRLNLIIRHSNTILYDLIIASVEGNDKVPSPLRALARLNRRIRAYVKFFLTVSLYSSVKFHIANCLENKMLLQILLNRHVYCYVNQKILPAANIKLNRSTLHDTLRIIWASRYSPAKDIPTLVRALNKISLEKPDFKFFLYAYTSHPDAMKYDFKSFNFPSDKYEIFPWTSYSYQESDIFVHTSYHEGLANSFMEQLSNSTRFIVCPLTSSGFLEFAAITPSIKFYRPGDYNSLSSCLNQCIKTPSSYIDIRNVPVDKYEEQNAQFFDFISNPLP